MGSVQTIVTDNSVASEIESLDIIDVVFLSHDGLGRTVLRYVGVG